MSTTRQLNRTDRLVSLLDHALRTVAAPSRAQRPCPVPAMDAGPLTPEEAQESAALMRVNHVGEVCAQALYTAQAVFSRDDALSTQLAQAAQEEVDHLAWTRQRIDELGGRPSLLLPLWWGGAFGMGLAAGAAGDAWSLGFVVETERQVEAHLASHLEKLPAGDAASRAIVAQMKVDEAAHADMAQAAGARPLPEPVRQAMRLAARVMTRTAHHL